MLVERRVRKQKELIGGKRIWKGLLFLITTLVLLFKPIYLEYNYMELIYCLCFWAESIITGISCWTIGTCSSWCVHWTTWNNFNQKSSFNSTKRTAKMTDLNTHPLDSLQQHSCRSPMSPRMSFPCSKPCHSLVLQSQPRPLGCNDLLRSWTWSTF